MRYIYAVIKGEANLNKYIARRWKGQRINWTGCFGHIDECTVELFDQFDPSGKCNRYYILYLPSDKPEATCSTYDISRAVHKAVREGTQKFLEP